jgi:hypothetical protein
VLPNDSGLTNKTLVETNGEDSCKASSSASDSVSADG